MMVDGSPPDPAGGTHPPHLRKWMLIAICPLVGYVLTSFFLTAKTEEATFNMETEQSTTANRTSTRARRTPLAEDDLTLLCPRNANRTGETRIRKRREREVDDDG